MFPVGSAPRRGPKGCPVTESSKKTYCLTITGILLAVGLVLPFLTGQIQAISRTISPLHIPVLICGLCCGWKWGLGLGIVLPLLRSLLFGMPPFPSTALPMVFELAVYGLLTGLIYAALLKKNPGGNHLPKILGAMIPAMIIGRFVGGAAKALFIAVGVIGSKTPYTFAAFFAAYFTSTAVGALIHIILVPAVVLALERAGLSPMTGKRK